jgi:DNA-binding NtrC family response regulator
MSADAVQGQMETLIEELKGRLQAYERWQGRPGSESALGLKARLEEYERELVASALEAHGMNQILAARQLGVLPTTLSEKMKRLGLRGPGRRTLTESK